MATKGKKLSDAYIELRADDSKLSGDVKVKATRAAKGFGAQLNNALKALDIDPVDVKADPKSALAAIDETRDRLRVMSRDAESVEMRVRTERALTQLERFRKQLGQVGDEPVKVEADPSPARRQVEQLQKRLASLGIDPPVTIDADPKAALAAVKRVDDDLEKLSKSASTVQLRMDAQSARNDLGRLKQQISDVGDDSATGFAARFIGRLGPLVASMPLSPPMLVAVGAAAAVAAPLLAAALAGAVVGGVGVGGVLGGVKLAARDQRVKAAGASLGGFILGDLESRASHFVPVVLEGIDDIRAGWRSLGPDLDRVFASSRFIDPLVAGAVSGGRKLIGGFADAVENADPIVDAFGRSIDRIGGAGGEVFSTLAEDADEGASAIDDLTGSIASLIRVTGGIIHGAAQVKGYSDSLDVWADRTRYVIEDQSHLNDMMSDFGYRLDLTADGFATGSREAEAYRKATEGTATASEFATLKAAGMTDAQIAAADASGTYRARTDEVNEALGRSSGFYVDARTEVERLAEKMMILNDIQGIGQRAMEGLLSSTGAVTGAMQAQKQTAELLRDAHERMFGAAIRSREANEGYEASWDDLSAAVAKNGGSLDVHTAKGRDNRNALQDLLGRTSDLYYAEIETGTSIAGATKKHEDRIKAVREEARRVGLNKTETDKLITTYGRIPPKKTTELLVDGFGEIARMLTDLYAYQRSLATGQTLAATRSQINASLRGGYAGDPRKYKREGGEITGSGLRGVDSVPIVAAPGEFMQPTPAVDYYGVAAMQAIRQRQIPREALQGFATGGLIDHVKDRNWGSRMRYEVDVQGARIPSREQVANAVIPEFGSWPSSPSAQRGDSGVWRRILALVKGSGIPYEFGNSYRPGDPKWHGSGRAVDFMGYDQDRLARFFMGMQSRVLELIHRSDSGDYAITRGRRASMPTQLPLHRNHLHVAMDNGGELMPGWNPPIYNGTGRPEPVTPAPIMDVVIEELRLLRGDTQQLAVDLAEALTGGVQSARQLGRARGRVVAR